MNASHIPYLGPVLRIRDNLVFVSVKSNKQVCRPSRPSFPKSSEEHYSISLEVDENILCLLQPHVPDLKNFFLNSLQSNVQSFFLFQVNSRKAKIIFILTFRCMELHKQTYKKEAGSFIFHFVQFVTNKNGIKTDPASRRKSNRKTMSVF